MILGKWWDFFSSLKKKKKKLKIEQLDSKQERSPNRSNQTIAPKPTETNLKME